MFNFHLRHARGELLFARCWLLGEGETEMTLFHEIARHLGIDLERAGVRCVPYRLGTSIELFLKVAKDFGIRWCVLTDNDSQGKPDQIHVKNNTEPSMLAQALHVMAEGDIEHHLCNSGFGGLYQAVYDAHPQLHSPPQPPPPCPSCGAAQKPRPRLSASTSDPEYWPQLLKVVKNVLDKPGTALNAVQEISSGRARVPPLLRKVIEDAVALAGGV